MRWLLAWLTLVMAAQGAPKVIAVNFDGMIHPVTAEILSHALEQAKEEQAAAVLIRINTPGGLLDATREITEKILTSPVPVICYVTPSGARAASAGFLILEACDIAAMSPGTRAGAASPVSLGRDMDPVMRSKVENDTAAALRGTVTKRGRNATLAETAVREARAFSDAEAVEQHLIDRVATSETELLNGVTEVTRFDGHKGPLVLAGATIEDYRKSIRETIVSAIADPNIAFILLVLGALGIYVEFSAPGTIAPGVIGGILAVLGLSGLSVLPINWAGAALIGLALALFILEAKFTSHGILGVGGAVSMVLGALLLVDGPPEMRIRLTTALGVSLPFALITMMLLTLVVRARRNKVITGDGALLSEIGEARTAIDPRGKVFVHGEYWDAEASAPIEPGSRVRVVGVQGMLLKVEKEKA